VETDLEQLATAHGVATSYVDWADKPVDVSREAVVAALSALGVDASTPDAVAAALSEVAESPWRRLLPPSVVLRGKGGSVVVRAVAEPTLEVRLESGGSHRVLAPTPGETRGERTAWTFELADLPLGWHDLIARDRDRTDTCQLVVAPDRIELPAGLGRAWGWMVQLYSLRSAASWDIGDYGDLRAVVETARADGAGAILLNPLHAETPVPPLNASLPGSRLPADQ
jgi:4-alpha-glucanotransferase